MYVRAIPNVCMHICVFFNFTLFLRQRPIRPTICDDQMKMDCFLGCTLVLLVYRPYLRMLDIRPTAPGSGGVHFTSYQLHHFISFHFTPPSPFSFISHHTTFTILFHLTSHHLHHFISFILNFSSCLIPFSVVKKSTEPKSWLTSTASAINVSTDLQPVMDDDQNGVLELFPLPLV